MAVSGHFQGQRLSAQDVEMQMRYGLARIGSAVGDNPVAPRQVFRGGDLGNHLKNVGNHSAVARSDAVAAGDMGLWNHQNMGGNAR